MENVVAREHFIPRSLTGEERAVKKQMMENLKSIDHNAYEAALRAEYDCRRS